MAEEKSFEDVKQELKGKLEAGFVLDDEKMADLEAELKEKGNDISQIDISKYQKKEQESPKTPKGKSNGTTISDHDPEADEKTHESNEGAEAPVDDHWKEDYKREWRDWAEQNGKIFDESQIPDDNYDISFRLYDNESKKHDNEYAAEISYKGPRNVTLKGRDGKAPDSKYFEQTVAHAMKKNGPDIEFGDIKTPEFKAKLLAACYLNGANPVGNVPSEKEISEWPKELQDMVNEAKTKAAEKTPEQEKNKEPEPKQTTNTNDNKEQSSTAKRIAELRKRIETRNENLQEAKDAAMAAGGELQEEDILKISQEGMSAEEIKLRELRGAAKNGDKTAGHELDKRRYDTMSNDYKYEREVEMEADGKTPKKDEQGKPVYKKDEQGKPVYKKDEHGKPVKTAAYKAFLTKAAQNLQSTKS